jgi:hypothetical protein
LGESRSEAIDLAAATLPGRRPPVFGRVHLECTAAPARTKCEFSLARNGR